MGRPFDAERCRGRHDGLKRDLPQGGRHTLISMHPYRAQNGDPCWAVVLPARNSGGILPAEPFRGSARRSEEAAPHSVAPRPPPLLGLAAAAELANRCGIRLQRVLAVLGDAGPKPGEKVARGVVEIPRSLSDGPANVPRSSGGDLAPKTSGQAPRRNQGEGVALPRHALEEVAEGNRQPPANFDSNSHNRFGDCRAEGRC